MSKHQRQQCEEALSAEQFRNRLSYDPNTGELRWNPHTGGRRSGLVAGHLNANGYRMVKLFGRNFMAHRVAYLIMTGIWPPGDMDHKNHTRDDNRWSNLRVVNRTQNNRSAVIRKDNSTGFKGIWPQDGKFCASIQVDKKRLYLGYYADPIEAAKAYDAAAIEHFGEFAVTNASLGLL